MRKKRIGIMGGTFNPIHFGHLLIAENASEQFGLDEVFFLPTGNPPHKDAKQVLDASFRSEMILLAIENNAHFRYSDYELKQEGVSYTYRTLESFHGLYSDAELYFIMGADSLAYFGKWKRPEEISRYCTVLAAVRDQLSLTELKPMQRELFERYRTRVAFINAPSYEVSSHMIRQRIEDHRSIKYLVPERVEEYIYEHRLYVPRAGAGHTEE